MFLISCSPLQNGRPNAANLFTHATVNDLKGLILLPDNWDNEALPLELSVKEGGMFWNAEIKAYQHDDGRPFDGYALNSITKDDWKDYEYAGAVFLPGTFNTFSMGIYWTRDEADANNAKRISFMNRNVIADDTDPKVSKYSLRPVRVVD